MALYRYNRSGNGASVLVCAIRYAHGLTFRRGCAMNHESSRQAWARASESADFARKQKIHAQKSMRHVAVFYLSYSNMTLRQKFLSYSLRTLPSNTFMATKFCTTKY